MPDWKFLAVTSLVSVVAEEQRLSLESVGFASARLDGIVWSRGTDTHTGVTLTNIAPNVLTVTVTARQETNKKVNAITLNSRETQVVDLREFALPL